MRCPSCNSKIPDDSRVCPECGKKLKKKYKRKKEREYERKKKAANGLVILIIFLCTLLLAGFILIAAKILLVDGDARRNASSVMDGQETAGSDTQDYPELSGDTIVPAGGSEDAGTVSADTDAAAGKLPDTGEADLSAGNTEAEILIENPSKTQTDAADYDLTKQAKVTMTGQMYQQGSEKELLLPGPRSFYGKDATGTKVLVSQADTIHFASSQSKVSIQELRAVPNGSSLTCTGDLYIYDNAVFMRLDEMSWEADGPETAVG